ncbi:MAG: FAD-binding oxidoreductase [Flavobacteriales bacterium]|nr:FAD-binding oxidoreductase [Flavobacteriales bacterium]
MNSYDFALVGQGLAGSLLAMELIRQGKSVIVVEQPAPITASRVAAGMFNPVVFKRLNLSWNAKEFLPLALDYYHQLEQELGVKCCFAMPLARFFNDAFGANQFAVEADGSLLDHLSVQSYSELDNFDAPFGYGIVTSAGYVDLNILIDAVRDWLISRESWMELKVDPNSIQFSKSGVQFEKVTAGAMICANGTGILDWPQWSHLPITRTKGQVLTIENATDATGFILNNGKFLLPVGGKTYRAGSTYEWTLDHNDPDETGKHEILDKLKPFLKSDHCVTHHVAGNRPTCKDRRPVLGWHPSIPRLAVFNGLGTRGVILAPAMTLMMANLLLSNIEPIEEASVRRFDKYFKNN